MNKKAAYLVNICKIKLQYLTHKWSNIDGIDILTCVCTQEVYQNGIFQRDMTMIFQTK